MRLYHGSYCRITEIEVLLTDLVIKTSERFNLSFEDALAAVSQSKLANDLAATGNFKNQSSDELYAELFDEISKGY